MVVAHHNEENKCSCYETTTANEDEGGSATKAEWNHRNSKMVCGHSGFLGDRLGR